MVSVQAYLCSETTPLTWVGGASLEYVQDDAQVGNIHKGDPTHLHARHESCSSTDFNLTKTTSVIELAYYLLQGVYDILTRQMCVGLLLPSLRCVLY